MTPEIRQALRQLDRIALHYDGRAEALYFETRITQAGLMRIKSATIRNAMLLLQTLLPDQSDSPEAA